MPGGSTLDEKVSRQSERAIAEADAVLFVVDATVGVTEEDGRVAQLLRRSGAPVFLVANKVDDTNREAGTWELVALGVGDPWSVSALHGRGTGDLLDGLIDVLPGDGPDDIDEAPAEDIDPANRQFAVAIVGRPNVGKSTLANALLGEDRLLTGPEAGITRDAIAVDWQWKGTPIRLIDTAGLRRRARVVEKLERLSGADTDRAVRYAHVVVLVLDANDMLEKQDLTIARHVIEEGRALIIAANKWDAIEDKNEALKKLKERVEKSLPQVTGIPIVTLSARSGRNLDKLMSAVFKIYAEWNKRVPTAQLNRYLEAAMVAHPPPLVRGRRIKLRYMTQIKTRPPTFALFAAKADDLPDAYARYLINGIRERFGLSGAPIRLQLKRTDNPFAERE
jgi:GTP-binding protein